MIHNYANKACKMYEFQVVSMNTGVFVNGRNYPMIEDKENCEQGTVADFWVVVDRVFGQQVQLELEAQFNRYNGECCIKVDTSSGKFELWIG